MRKADLYWLAGLLEGEGGFYTFQQRKRRVGADFRITVGMTDIDVVERAASLLGCNVCGPYATRGRPMYSATLGRRQDVLALARELQPLMGERRRAAIQEMLDTAATLGYDQ